ncbi:SDR family NAD(P)-dependent oxidoreductase [Mariprofundus ferrooxydans]|uniref:Short chain dehydrogenase n=1 Tax=Mariprofundus ferrooxydans PV-1 TaxID=314345 RepID=Q0F3M2_9PROT|nr:SDR family NAD(P)-dependent oxidoreductase [Mariprofundus ferrooxydans]EAU55919.1 short chain dehydrogenase [Mariprofundus ferrooxydans PV-1]KON48196.1 short-chain dehydrogenase [Mariprofundus ferrooxydans]
MTRVINDKSIVMVTGASAGLGRAVCVSLGKMGANVIALARDVDALAKTQDLVEQAGGRCLCVPFDLLEFDAYGKLFLRLKDQIPHLDGLIHCAGSLQYCTPMQYVKTDDFRAMLDIHLTAPNMLTQSMLPLIRRAEEATVVFTSCEMLDNDLPNWHAYGLAKRALGYAAAMWHAEHADKAYRFVTIDPGRMRTALFRRAFMGMDPMEVPGPEQAAEGFLRMLAATADAVNGKSLKLEDALGL